MSDYMARLLNEKMEKPMTAQAPSCEKYSVTSKEGHKVEVWPDKGLVWFSFGEHCYGTGAKMAFELWHQQFFKDNEIQPDCQPKPSEGTDDKQLAAIRASCETPARAGTQYQADVRFLFATIERQAGEIARYKRLWDTEHELHKQNGYGYQDDIRRLEADLAAARLNERRYLWLREGGKGTGLYVADSGRDWCLVGGNELDELTDDAIAAGDGK